MKRDLKRELKINGIYVHYKSDKMKYQVLTEAINTETLEKLVVYKSLYEHGEYKKGTIWARPKNMFLEELPLELQKKYNKKYRFELISEKEEKK